MEVLNTNGEVIRAAASRSSTPQRQNGQHNATESRESLEIDNLPQSLALIPAGLEVVPYSDKEPVQPEKEAVQAEKEAISREEKEVVGPTTQPDGRYTIWQGPKTSRRICGLRASILMAALVAIVVAVALGAGLGIGLHNSNSTRGDPTSSSESRTASTTTLGTSIVVPSGTYALSLSSPTNVQAGCLLQTSLNQAWGCDLAGAPALAISVGVPAASRPTPGAFFFYASVDSGIEYGAQYRYMNTQLTPYQAVQETGEDDKGPALYFAQSYNKIVILPESAFTMPSGAQKKREYRVPTGFMKDRQLVSHGETPWVCVWNDTLIEGWIYVEQSIRSSLTITTSSSSPSTSTSNVNPTEKTSNTNTSGSLAVISTEPRAQVTTALATSAVASSSQTGYEDRKRHLQKRQTAESRATLDDNDERLSADQEEALDTYHNLPPYPYLIKIEERRVPIDGSVPYCQQFQMLDNGDLSPLSTPDHPNGITFELAEQPPAYSAYDENASVGITSRSTKRQTSANACHCEWWAQ